MLRCCANFCAVGGCYAVIPFRIGRRLRGFATAEYCGRVWKAKATSCSFFSHFSLCSALRLCASREDLVPPEAVIHPAFGQRFTTWDGERVQVALTPSLRGESLKYLAKYDQVFLANSIRERGLRHEYKIAGKGTSLVVYSRNPGVTQKEKHYPTSGIVLGLTAVKEWRPGQMPILKLYDAFDPTVVKSSHDPHPIAANYTATLAVLYSHARSESWKRTSCMTDSDRRP